MAPNLDTVEQYAGCIDGRIKNYQKQHGRKVSGKFWKNADTFSKSPNHHDITCIDALCLEVVRNHV